MQNSTVEDINQRLKIYGVNGYGSPIFRVVFSDEQLEKRWGTFRDHHSKIILIREIREVREVQKYPWIKEKWILERWIPGEVGKHRDLVTEQNGIYVCVYVFQDVEQNYLPPLMKVCEIVIKALLNPRTKGEALSEDRKVEERQDELEVDAIEEEMKIHSDLVASQDPKSSRESMSVGYTSDKI